MCWCWTPRRDQTPAVCGDLLIGRPAALGPPEIGHRRAASVIPRTSPPVVYSGLHLRLGRRRPSFGRLPRSSTTGPDRLRRCGHFPGSRPWSATPMGCGHSAGAGRRDRRASDQRSRPTRSQRPSRARSAAVRPVPPTEPAAGLDHAAWPPAHALGRSDGLYRDHRHGRRRAAHRRRDRGPGPRRRCPTSQVRRACRRSGRVLSHLLPENHPSTWTPTKCCPPFRHLQSPCRAVDGKHAGAGAAGDPPLHFPTRPSTKWPASVHTDQFRAAIPRWAASCISTTPRPTAAGATRFAKHVLGLSALSLGCSLLEGLTPPMSRRVFGSATALPRSTLRQSGDRAGNPVTVPVKLIFVNRAMTAHIDYLPEDES